MDTPAAMSVIILVVLVSMATGAQKCSFDGQFLVNEADCHSFFKCDHGRPVPFQCGPGTAWSRHLNTCDYTHLVPECQRPLPESNPSWGNNNYDYWKKEWRWVDAVGPSITGDMNQPIRPRYTIDGLVSAEQLYYHPSTITLNRR